MKVDGIGLGVGIDVVKRALKRLGLRRRKTTTQRTLPGHDEPVPSAAEREPSSAPPAAAAAFQTAQDRAVDPTPSPSTSLTAAAPSPLDAPAGPPPAAAKKPVVVGVGGGSVVVGKVEVIRVPLSQITNSGRDPSTPPSTPTPAGDPDLEASPHIAVPVPTSAATAGSQRGFTVDQDPKDRSGDRALARLGLLEDALPLFAEADYLPRAGVLLAVPLLAKHGLLEAFEQVYASALGPSFYGLRTLAVTLLLCALLRIKRPEHLKEHAPWEWGGLLGLDRAPEVKTVRRKLTCLAEQNRAAELMAALARRRIAADDSRVAFLYVDGHVREYHGRHPLAKTKKPQSPVARRAATDTWVHDAKGEPLLVVTGELNPGLTKVLEPILAEVRKLVGPRRVTVIFDRGGFSPKLFARLIAAGFDIITYRKGSSRDRPRHEFQKQTLDVDGRLHHYVLCDRGKVRVGRLRNKRKKKSRAAGPEFFWMREVRVLRRDGRQTPILTNRQDLSAVEVAYRAFDRWRQENYLKYAAAEFALDALVEYAVRDVSAEADRPNPEKKRLRKELSRARGEVSRLQAELGQAVKSSSTRTMRGFRIVQAKLRRELESAEAELNQLREASAQTPARVSASDLKTLTTEKKLIVDAIKMSAYQIETELLGMIQGIYARSVDEGRTLLHAAFQTAGKMEVSKDELRITLQAQSSPHRTEVLSQLCSQLNDLGRCFPGTKLRLYLAVDCQKPEALTTA